MQNQSLLKVESKETKAECDSKHMQMCSSPLMLLVFLQKSDTFHVWLTFLVLVDAFFFSALVVF